MRYGHHHGHGCGPRGRIRPRLSREEWLRRLEEYQRDLEQEAANVAEMIRRLKESAQPQTATL